MRERAGRGRALQGRAEQVTYAPELALYNSEKEQGRADHRTMSLRSLDSTHALEQIGRQTG